MISGKYNWRMWWKWLKNTNKEKNNNLELLFQTSELMVSAKAKLQTWYSDALFVIFDYITVWDYGNTCGLYGDMKPDTGWGQ